MLKRSANISDSLSSQRGIFDDSFGVGTSIVAGSGLGGKNPSLGHYAHYVPTAATANLGYLNSASASTIAADQISRYTG
jgi:hypothetical protein